MSSMIIEVDSSLKIGFKPDGAAWAEAYVGEQPRTFPARARAKAKATRSKNVAALCSKWADKWEAQNPGA